MRHTMTFDASHKVGRDGAHLSAFFKHLQRDADAASGFAFGHSNPRIDASRTHLNRSFVNDGAGGFRPPRSVAGNPPSDEMRTYLEERLTTVQKSLRKDAVLIRGIVLQLDPRWFEEHDPQWRENGVGSTASRFINTAWKWAADEFGQENIVGGALHLDEHSPQLQLAVTPVTSDGRLSQKDFFRGPSDLKRQHRELRLRMEEAGYEVEHGVTERSKEHLSSSAFARNASRAEKAAKEAESLRQAAEAELAAAAEELRLASVARAEAEQAAAQHRRAAEELQALSEDLSEELKAAGPAPAAPDFDGLRDALLERQSHVAMRFIRTFAPFRDGSTLLQRFERFARAEFAHFVRSRADAFGARRSISFNAWIARSTAAHRKASRALAAEDITPARARNLDRSFGD